MGGGQLVTPWCEGTWRPLENDPEVIDMSFGSSGHLCRFKDGGFFVEEKFLLRNPAKSSYKPGQLKSCGWIRGPNESSKVSLQPRKRKERESDDEGQPQEASFVQKDLRFDAFFKAWSGRQQK